MKLQDLVRVAPKKLRDEMKQEKRKNRPEVDTPPEARGDGVGKGSDLVDPQDIV